MSKLAAVVKSDYKDVQKIVNAMFAYNKKQMAQALRDYQSNIIKIIAFHLANMPQITYSFYLNSRTDKTLQAELDKQSQVAQRRIEPLWEKLRGEVHLTGRLAGGYFSRKAQPPWHPVKMDLQSPIPKVSKGTANYRGAIPYYLKRLETLIMDQIHLGIKNEESVTKIMSRVRALFAQPRNRFTEGKKTPIRDDDESYTDTQTIELFDKPPVEMTEGTYTAEDIDELRANQKEAMGWFYTDYKPDMDEAIWARNKAFMGLEQDIMSDAVDMLSQGMIQIGSDNMGIKDFVWQISAPQKERDECGDRNGLTTTQIKDQIKDKYGTRPPRLHPHCYCQLVPKINDDWAKGALQAQGLDGESYQWNQDSGLAFSPTQKQRALGFTDMSWNQWLGSMGGASVQQRNAQ